MMTVVVVGLSLLTALEPDGAVAGTRTAAESKDDTGAARARYDEMKAKTPQTAAAQWKLANWCQQNHLDPEAFVHYTAVAMLQPGREAVWRKLGFRKHHGRWMTDAQIADEAKQAKADKEWGGRLKRIHHEIHGGKKQAEAWTAIGEIEDARAVPAVFHEFGAGSTSDQAIAIQVLGQIDVPLSSKLLAVLAVYGKTPEVRRRATETLRGRKADDYLPILVNLMADPLKYEVRPVGGPGAPGVLFVQGERFNVRRFYDAPAPFLRFQPGDIVSYDENGLPAIVHPIGTMYSKLLHETGTRKTGTTDTFRDTDIAVRYSMTEMLVEAQRGAISAQLQLQADIEAIEALNQSRNAFNELVMNVARDACGKNPGKEPKDWRDALAAKDRYPKPRREPRKPTFDELVPLAYLPRFGVMTMVNVQRIVTTPPDT